MPVFSAACVQIVTAIRNILQTRHPPILIAIDGGSGAGKSTLAARLAQEMDSVIVSLDDFYAANIPDWEWEARPIPERARDVFDWQRLRADALEPLLAGQPAKWYPFDFAAGLRPDGTYALCQQPVEKQPAPVIILEGAYAASPEITDLVDLTVLLDVPTNERHRRLAQRESDRHFLQRWHTLWDDVESYYFSEVRPKSAFNVVVAGSSD